MSSKFVYSASLFQPACATCYSSNNLGSTVIGITYIMVSCLDLHIVNQLSLILALRLHSQLLKWWITFGSLKRLARSEMHGWLILWPWSAGANLSPSQKMFGACSFLHMTGKIWRHWGNPHTNHTLSCFNMNTVGMLSIAKFLFKVTVSETYEICTACPHAVKNNYLGLKNSYSK